MRNTEKRKKPEPIKMTALEKEQWGSLYQYVKKEILQYDDNQKISPQLILRLKGLKDGKLIANKSTQKQAEYSFEVILNTFKICRFKILNAISGKTFKNEMSKCLYICTIVESEINDVYLRMQNVEKSKEKIEKINTDSIEYEGADYKTKTNSEINEHLKDIW